MKNFRRKKLINWLETHKNCNKIKFVTGIYNVGKTRLILECIDHIYRTEKNPDIQYVDFGISFHGKYSDFSVLADKLNKNEDFADSRYLFIDSAEKCSDISALVRDVYGLGIYDIYVISDDRDIFDDSLVSEYDIESLEVLPVSFSEYCDLFEEKQDVKKLFEEYITGGGIFGPEDMSLYYSEFKRSMINAYSIQDQRMFSTLLIYMIENAGLLKSPNRIADDLKTNGNSVNHVTVGKYLKCLLSSGMFCGVKRFDIKNRKIIETTEKYYCTDIALLKKRDQIYEHLVFFELIRRGYLVYTGKLYQKEIDFVAKKDNELLYIQTAGRIGDGSAELKAKNLLLIRDGHPKIIIGDTGREEYQYNGVRILNIIDWLLSDKEL